MSVGAIFGLILLNLFLLGAGSSVFYGVRGWISWSEVALLGGLAYMLGVAAVGVLLVMELVVGLPFSLAAILLTGLAVIVVGFGVGRALGHPHPRWPDSVALPLVSVSAAFFASLTLLVLEALFRADRLTGLSEYDAWAFWVPKAKAIFFLGGLDEQFFRSLPAPSYPPLVPALEASAFHFMGSPDVVTLHLQFWFFFVGFVAAVVGLLAQRVPPLLLWPPALVVLVAPQIIDRALQPQADLLLDELMGLAALLVGLWVLDRRNWQLVAATLLLAGAMLTKREGFLLTACVITAALAVSWREVRRAWPPLLLLALLAFLPSLSWRIWFSTRGLPSDVPASGGTGLIHHLDRAWPSLKLTLRVLFTYDLWLIVLPVLLLAVVAAFLARKTALAAYAILVIVFSTAGFTWITWSFPTLPITENAALNPIIRAIGSIVLASAGLIPLLLAAAWNPKTAPGRPT